MGPGRSRWAAPETMLARIENAVRAHRDQAEPLDDSTLVVLRVGSDGQNA